MPADDTDQLGEIGFSPDGEEWVEYGPPAARQRLRFHDYAAIYAVPGLYERIFQDTLGMRSTAEVVRLYGEVLERCGLDPSAQRVVDFGAGNGLGGIALRELGVGLLVGVDLEPIARDAAERDHPGVYDGYLIGDVGAWSDRELGELAAHEPTAVLALSAVGLGHVPRPTLERVMSLLGSGGLYAFAVAPALLPDSDDEAGRASGYPAFLAELARSTEQLARSEYVHRRRADGSDDPAVALVGRIR